MSTAQPASGSPALRLRVTAAAESIVRAGHPWVFADSIRELNRDGQAGELAVIYDRKDRFLAIGLYDPGSPIRVRILHAGKPEKINAEWWRARLARPLAARQPLFDERTNGYRCVNGESDGWPGLVVDRYDTTYVLKLYTAAWLPRLAEISALLLALVAAQFPQSPGAGPGLILRLSRNIHETAARNFQLVDGAVLAGTKPEGAVVFSESGLRFESEPVRGQKTGFFLDQRENRRLVETLAGGRKVLNAFSFSGGFSLYAARGGASSATDLDVSTHALEAAGWNFKLNADIPAVAACAHRTEKADVFDWLWDCPPAQYDLVIIDPPSLAKRESEKPGALAAYENLAALGIRALEPDGILLAASCSAHVNAEEFFGAVRVAAAKSGRRVSEIRTTFHAPDHPARFPEANYLKAIYLRVA